MPDNTNAKFPRLVQNNQPKKKQPDLAAAAPPESYLQHPHKGRIAVLTLYCNCGQAIFVEARQNQPSVRCNRCHSDFRWQQLTFADLNAA